MATIDSYGSGNIDNMVWLASTAGNYNKVYQAFQVSTVNYTLRSASFSMSKFGSPGGTFAYKVYAITGTPGTNAVPTGSALATSSSYNANSLPDFTGPVGSDISLNFTPTLLAPGWYALAIEITGGDDSNGVVAGFDNSSPSHAGNPGYALVGSGYASQTGIDYAFSVTGDAEVTLSVNNGTHGLTSDSITFVTPVSGSGSVYYGGFGLFFMGSSYYAEGVGLGTVSLLVDNATHALGSTAVVLVMDSTAAVDNASHGLTSTTVILVENTVLAPDNASHGLLSTAPTLSTAGTVSPDNATHGLTSESPAITQVHILTVDSASHGTTSTAPGLVQDHNLSPSASTIGVTSTAVVVVMDTTLAPAASLIGLTSDAVAITQQHFISVNPSLHGLSSTSPAIIESMLILVNDSTIGLSSSNITLIFNFILSVLSANHDITSDGWLQQQSGIYYTSDDDVGELGEAGTPDSGSMYMTPPALSGELEEYEQESGVWVGKVNR